MAETLQWLLRIGKQMARNVSSDRQKPSKAVRTGFEKMQMNHLQTRKKIQRIKTEAAERVASGKPVHARNLPRR
jgi:hypothetical protein